MSDTAAAVADKKGHKVTIIVNATPKVVDDKEMTFIEIVQLEFPNADPSNGNVVYTVTYKKGPGSHKEGSMAPGDVVKIKNGMIFNVSATDKS